MIFAVFGLKYPQHCTQGGTNGELDFSAIWRHLVTFLAFDDIYILDMYLPTKFHVNWTKSKGVMVSQAFGYIFDI